MYIEVCGFLFSSFFFFVLPGDWMNTSAGVAFAPHVITIGVGEVAHVLSNFLDI